MFFILIFSFALIIIITIIIIIIRDLIMKICNEDVNSNVDNFFKRKSPEAVNTGENE